ncbi:Scramblase [Artemisia annua]|uniref:Phospholipid scramblase n=1 Tax=Artemisia annua TaxID=35608 RepID=A0A2U1P9F2_ARTAN|nr:Scramblase [Artemisia annua]
MNRVKNLQLVTRFPKVSSQSYSVVNKQQNACRINDKTPLFKESGFGKGDNSLAGSLVSEKKLYWRSYGLYTSGVNKCRSRNYSMNFVRKFGNAVQNSTDLSREFLVQLWVADDKLKRIRDKRKQYSVENASKGETVFGTKGVRESYISGSSVTEDDSIQYEIEHEKSASAREAMIASLLSRSNLLITRDIEWANLTLGFEQLLRTRRPFVATITDGYGNELFRVRRPFWWLTSSIYTEVGGKEIGVVHRRWHLWRRIYDLYLGDEQFAVVENPGFWNWTFTLKGREGEVLAEIDRDWRGFGFEVFTDAGQYVIRFGSSGHDPMSKLSEKVQDFEVARPLTLSERAVTVALAVSLDNDYFSRHGGWGIPFIAVAE